MPKPAKLEAFELIQGGATDQPSQDWVAGHAAGLAEAAAEIQKDQADLSEQLVQTLSDMAFGYHEARAHMISALVPMFTQLIDALVPRLAHEMLVPHIAGHLADRASDAIGSPVTIALNPGEIDSVAASLAGLKDSPCKFHADPALSAGQAVIQTGADDHLLDLDDLVRQTQAILATLIDASQQGLNHG